MSRKLVFIHGRAQQRKDSIALKKEWLQSWDDGLRDGALERAIDDADVRFPYYGDTLDDLVKGKPLEEAALVVVRGAAAAAPERVFMSAVMEEVRKAAAITKDELLAIGGGDVIQRGPLNWEWLQTIMQAIDRHVPFGSGASVALATYDVYQYLNNKVVAKAINDGVMQAMTPGVETIVVSHSLGTVVAYNLLRNEGAARGWKVPLFVTLGSPLAVRAIRDSLLGREVPACVGRWYNAMDDRDVVALYPLDRNNFNVDPGVIENKTDVRNPTENRHGISGYLGDKEVARVINEALA